MKLHQFEDDTFSELLNDIPGDFYRTITEHELKCIGNAFIKSENQVMRVA